MNLYESVGHKFLQRDTPSILSEASRSETSKTAVIQFLKYVTAENYGGAVEGTGPFYEDDIQYALEILPSVEDVVTRTRMESDIQDSEVDEMLRGESNLIADLKKKKDNLSSKLD